MQNISLFITNIIHGVQDRQEQKQQSKTDKKQSEKFTVSHSSQNAYTVNKILYIKPLRQHQQTVCNQYKLMQQISGH